MFTVVLKAKSYLSLRAFIYFDW